MRYSDNAMCTILLSSYIGIKEGSDVKPLSLGEWHKFIDVLVQNKLEPSIVYSTEIVKLKEIGYDEAFLERIKALVGRGASVAFELEEYEKRGLFFDRYSKEEIIKLLTKLNLIDKKSDSGDAQYVKPIL